ncbi:uncharacterized protein VDAG_05323 [Verticillium dahliae VdLs.17]|uniref:C2H2-type domain-containing protein n=3 Tax=Verticillium TaxID=1036719 RepID=G2X607_VERDV|nr:uncharacterized protein VDAG_05323 [Verticillium dahliae VdLs.17]EGY14159.1 hypothetical protein VDAG_05323 [Verticillium dahliae VdLs.17]KAH6701191.1 hypothetical protein EV126DRAFT_442467 [Verticillium dahliae]
MAAGERLETTDRGSKPLACTHCNARFSRPSHLHRHRLTHLPSSRKSLIKCPHCDITFSRNNVLLRHLRGAHHVDLVVKRSSCTGAQAICKFPGASHSRSPDLESETPDALDGNERTGVMGVAGFSAFDPSFESTDIPHTPQILQTPDSTSGNSLFPATYLGTQRHADDLDNDSAVSSVEGFGQADNAIFGINALEPDGAGISPSHFALMQPDFRTIGFDWLDFDMPESTPGLQEILIIDTTAVERWSDRQTYTPQPLPPTGRMSSQHPDRPPTIEQGQARTAQPSPTLRPLEPQQALQPWPFDHAQDSAPHRYMLPPLRDVLQSSFRGGSSDRNNALNSLIQILSDRELPASAHVQDANTAQALSDLQRLLDLYFARFHDIQPILHRPTWYTAECPTVLLTAMACVGALLSDEERDKELSWSLSDICMPMITWLGWDFSVVDGVLAKMTVTKSLWRPTPSMPTKSGPSGLCTLTSHRGAVDLSELPRTLPCTESLWNAPSAQAWVALRSRLGPGSLSTTLSTILKAVLAGHAFPSCLGTWAKRLCGQVIGRLLWDLKQLEIVAMPEHFGLTSLLSAHQQSKQSLLGALRKLLESMGTVSTTSELISYNITGLLCHYSHLYAANDVTGVIIYIVRSLISQRAKHHKGIEVARKRLRSSFAQDRRSSRRLVHHAAQIIAIANEYLVSAPCEIMRTFMGYVFILAYSSYGPRAELMPGGKTPIRLDVPLHQPAQQQFTLQWIDDGGPAGLGSVVNILADDCVPAISRDAQLMMQRLKCWGLADQFTKILHIFDVNGF